MFQLKKCVLKVKSKGINLTHAYYSLVFRLPSSPRTSIQKHRTAVTGLLYLLFMFGLDPNLLGMEPDGSACRFFAIALHFVGLSTFAWTAIEGHQLHRALVRRRLTDADGRYLLLIIKTITSFYYF